MPTPNGVQFFLNWGRDRTAVQPWSTFNAALAETRAAFERANQSARSMFG